MLRNKSEKLKNVAQQDVFHLENHWTTVEGNVALILNEEKEKETILESKNLLFLLNCTLVTKGMDLSLK